MMIDLELTPLELIQWEDKYKRLVPKQQYQLMVKSLKSENELGIKSEVDRVRGINLVKKILQY